jgi:hypothetical protein
MPRFSRIQPLNLWYLPVGRQRRRHVPRPAHRAYANHYGNCESQYRRLPGVGKLDLVGGALLLQSSTSLSPGSLAFGDQNVGSKSSPQNVTLTNVSSSALDITNISVTGDPKDFEQTNKCGSSLPPHASCQIKVTFAPQSVGAKRASLSVSCQALAVRKPYR